MKLARPVAFADDTFLQGAPEPTMRAFQALGLEVQLAKCAVYSTNATTTTSDATQLGVQHAHDGLLATVTALGAAAFQEARADACADHACTLIDRMQALPPLDQDRWILLHGSLQLRVAHLPRSCQWEHVGRAIRRVGTQSGGHRLHHGPGTRGGSDSGADDPSPPTWWVGSVLHGPRSRQRCVPRRCGSHTYRHARGAVPAF
jgi:hypothetical protein